MSHHPAAKGVSRQEMRPVIFGLQGLTVTAEERSFFAATRPLGYILFARNINTPDQVRALVADLKTIAGGSDQEDGRDCLILVDQEGGRVARLRQPHWPETLAVAQLAASPQTAPQRVALHSCLIAAELQVLGINGCCYPVLDVPIKTADPIIGDRAFGRAPRTVAALGEIAARSLMEAGILPVIKHIPGHGRATVDSHRQLPRVTAPVTALADDFLPFQAVRQAALAMTAHIAYEAIDPGQPATFSQRVVTDIIREQIGFSGLLMTDDLSMQALVGDLGERALRALAAGCDILLHCNGDMAEMQAIARVCPLSSAAFRARLAMLLAKAAKEAKVLDLTALRADYAACVRVSSGTFNRVECRTS